MSYVSPQEREKVKEILEHNPEWFDFIISNMQPPKEVSQNALKEPYLMDHLSIKVKKSANYNVAEGSIIVKLNPRLTDPQSIRMIFDHWFMLLEDACNEKLGITNKPKDPTLDNAYNAMRKQSKKLCSACHYRILLFEQECPNCNGTDFYSEDEKKSQ